MILLIFIYLFKRKCNLVLSVINLISCPIAVYHCVSVNFLHIREFLNHQLMLPTTCIDSLYMKQVLKLKIKELKDKQSVKVNVTLQKRVKNVDFTMISNE